jgi:hypothetical protein
VWKVRAPSRLLKKSLDASATSHAAFGDGSRPGFLNLGGHPPDPLYSRSCEPFSTLLDAQYAAGVFAEDEAFLVIG